MLTAAQYCSSLYRGLDVDFVKTTPTRRAYHKARGMGVSIPKMFKDRGIDHVRLRTTGYDLAAIDTRIKLPFIDELQVVVDDCLAAGLTPILAFQGEAFKTNPTADERDRIVAWWTEVANRFMNYPDQLAFNLVIETTDAVSKNPAALNDLYRHCSDALDAIDPIRILIMPPAGISGPEWLEWLVIPKPETQFAETHFYAAGFNKPALGIKNKLWSTGTPEEKKALTDEMDRVADYVAAGKPAWIGAILIGGGTVDGDTQDTYVDAYTPAEQLGIAEFVASELRARNLPCAFNACWRYFSYETFTWIESQRLVLDELLRKE